jgi:hypothetical protein
MEALLDTCAITRIDATGCPLCTAYGSRLQSINQSNKCDVSLKQFQEHLGRHMEQLALAALPEEDAEEDEPLNEDEEQRSHDGSDQDVESLARNSVASWDTHRCDEASKAKLADIARKELERRMHATATKQLEKKPGFLNTLFRRTKKDTFDDTEFRHGRALNYPEIPGEERRSPTLEGPRRKPIPRSASPDGLGRMNLFPRTSSTSRSQAKSDASELDLVRSFHQI